MFWHNFKYSVKCILREKTTLFWTLIFPLALFTFEYLSFGNLMESDEIFSKIPVAVVREDESDTALYETLMALSEQGDNQVLDAEVMDEEEALESLKNENISGIIYTADASLTVLECDVYSSIIKSILDQYLQIRGIYENVAENDAMMAVRIVSGLMTDELYYTEVSTTDGYQNEYYNFFYAVFAMSCLFSSLAAIERFSRLQANASALGMRRSISPNTKLVSVISEYMAILMIQFLIELITLGYMMLFGIDFGNQYPAIILTLFIGCNIGISIGMLISALKCGEGTKTGITCGINMLCSVMADLCANGIKYFIECHAPIINRINPAALITDCFYALNVYDTYDRFFRNIITMGIMSVVLVAIGILILRRNKYASV